jgi:hypothetical protein
LVEVTAVLNAAESPMSAARVTPPANAADENVHPAGSEPVAAPVPRIFLD